MFNKKHILLATALFTTLLVSSASAETWALSNSWQTNSGMTNTWASSTWSMAAQSTTTVADSTVEISGVDIIDDSTLSVKIAWSLTNWVSDASEVKIFKDMKISKVEKDMDNAKKIKLSLDEGLDFGNVDYSLFSVSSIDTSIDFALTWTSSWTIKNTVATDAGIDYINIVDAKTVEVYLKKAPTADLTDFKLLKEVKINSMFYDVGNLNVKTQSALMSNSNYFFMFIALKDNSGKEIPVSNSMYDFATPDFTTLSTASGSEVSSWALLEPTSTGALDESLMPSSTSSGETLSWATTASWEIAIEDAAKDVKATPDTWTKTNILLVIALISSLGFVILRKKAFKN
jgi:hypothetical protein